MGSNTGETGGGSNDDSSRNNIKSRLDNRFERYLSLRGGTRGEESSSNTSKADIHNINTTTVQQEDDGNWNHITSPFKYTSTPSSLVDDDKTAESSTSPSVFTNVVRSQTVDRFSNIFMERIGNVMSSGKLSAAWQDGGGGGGSSMISWLLTDYSPEAKDKNVKAAINPNDYTAERNMMAPYFTPIVWGSSCMVITLLSIRTGRWYQGRQTAINTASRTEYWKGKQYVSNRATQSLQDVRHTKPLQPTQSNNPLHPRKAYLGSQVKKMASNLNTLPVDLAVSMLVGISTTLFLTRPQELMQDFARAPLLKGKSVFAEELCTPFSDEMKNINEMTYTYTPYKDLEAQQQTVIPYSELWRDENLGEFDSLRAVRDFVHNCHKREELERRKTEKRETIDGSSDEEDDIDHNNVFIC